MSDRPIPPPPDADPARPDHASPTAPDDTSVLPQAAAPPDAPPAAPQSAPAPPSSSAPVHGASAVAGTPAGGPRRWWREATSTGGGRAALAVAGALTAVFLLLGVVLLGGLVGRVVGWGHHDRMGFAGQRGPLSGWEGAPGRSDPAPGPGQGNGDGRRMGPDGSLRNGRGPGRGLGVLGGDVLHGEFTSTRSGTPTVMVVQTGEVTAYTSGRSMTVRSSDGFSATYSLDGSATPSQGVARLATGAQVRVVAAKEGMKVTRLVVVPSP